MFRASFASSGKPSRRSRRPLRATLESLEGRLLLALNPPAVGGDPLVNPADFRVTVFAEGLEFPAGAATASDGSLLVLENVPNGTSTSFYDTTSRVVRLVDADGNGVADGPPTVLASGLPGASSAIVRAGNFVVVTSSNGTISFLRTGASSSSSLTLAGAINLDFPNPWNHPTFALAARPTPAGDQEVFFNIGSQYNGIKKDASGNILFDANGVAIPDPTTGHVPASGLITATLDGDAIYRVTLHDDGGTPNLSGLIKIATGLRNAASMAFDPATGDFYFADNGIDGTSGGNAAYSTDTLFRIAAADLGTTVVNCGFPYSYTLTNSQPGQPDVVVNPAGRVPPIVSFQPLTDPSLPATGSQAEGASGFAISPPMFPAGLNRGVFVGFHGKFNSGGTVNEENPMRFVDMGTGHSFDFIGNGEATIGHLNGAVSTADSLFLVDVASTGQVFGGPRTGAIYQVKAVNHAPVFGTIENPTVDEGQPLSLAVAASDPDPGQSLTYSLASGAPEGASIDPATGVFTWTPPDGPGSVSVTVLATDNGSPALQASASFTITVNNVAPVVTLAPSPPRILIGVFIGAGTIRDPGADTVTATVNYGERSTSRPRRLRLAPDGSFRIAYRYTRPGSYVITVTATDSDGAVTTTTIPFVVPRFLFLRARRPR